MTYTAISAI